MEMSLSSVYYVSFFAETALFINMQDKIPDKSRVGLICDSAVTSCLDNRRFASSD